MHHNAWQSNNNTAFDWGGEGLLVRVVGRFKNWGIPQFDLLPVRLLWWKGGQKKITQQLHYVNKQILSCNVEQGLHLQGMSSPDLTAFLYVSLDTPLLYVLQPFITAVAQKGFLALLKIFFALNAQSYHFSCCSNERMTNWFFGWLLLVDPCSVQNACYFSCSSNERMTNMYSLWNLKLCVDLRDNFSVIIRSKQSVKYNYASTVHVDSAFLVMG